MEWENKKKQQQKEERIRAAEIRQSPFLKPTVWICLSVVFVDVSYRHQLTESVEKTTKMSLEESSKKDEPDLAQDPSDMDAKLSKDRKGKKEKVKPLAKVGSPSKLYDPQ